MLNSLKAFFDSSQYMPHGHCYLWRNEILWLHVGSDLLIGLAYFAIPLFMLRLIKQRKNLGFSWTLIMFAMFIVACGSSHFVDIWTVWNPDYAAQGVIKIITAFFSVTTVVMLFFLLPQAKSLPTVGQLGELNRRLQLEIEERKKAEQSIRSILDSAYNAFVALDEQGNISYWNKQAEALFGWNKSEVIGHALAETIVPERMRDRYSKNLQKFLAEGNGGFVGKCIEMPASRKDGQELIVEMTINAIEKGGIYAFSAFLHDISDRKKAEEKQMEKQGELEKRVEERTSELIYRKDQLRLITDALPVSIAYVDKSHRNQFINLTGAKWRKRPVDEIIGHHLKDVVGSQDYEILLPDIEKALSGQEIQTERELTFNGSKRYLSVHYIPDFNASGECRGFIALLTDITAQRASETELKRAKDAADAANAAKSAFLANMSHEIRTPLGAVLGFSDLLVSESLSASERKTYGAAIKRNGQLLSNIISDILDISKVEAGKFEIEKQKVMLAEVLTDIKTLLQLQAREKGLELELKINGDVPQTIYTDPLRLRQILVNIIGNSIKFTDRGHVIVKVRSLFSADGRTKLAFDVQDTGPGIDPNVQDRLFAAFSQVDASSKRKFGGTGLGLAISKRLANLLGGDVYLSESQIGFGSTFTIIIDPGLNESIIVESQPGKETILPISSEKITMTKPLAACKILLVEDVEDNRMLIGHLLNSAGAAVDTASNGLEALKKISSGDYGLILMDLQMPLMDGFEATAALRKAGYKKPIIALTAHALKEERQRCLSNGFNEHLSKPVNRELLLDYVGRLYRDSNDSIEATTSSSELSH